MHPYLRSGVILTLYSRDALVLVGGWAPFFPDRNSAEGGSLMLDQLILTLRLTLN